MTSPPLFDDALPILVRTLVERLGESFVEAGVIVRDASGRLSFLSPTAFESNDDHGQLSQLLNEVLGPYARQGRPIVFLEEGISNAFSLEEQIPMQIDGLFCKLVDRRIVGTGWLASPSAALASPPRIVFATLKGGVGRSTALAVTAADLARRNQNVLVIDLDLEAPGLGDLMLSDDRVPRYGVIDFLVENGLGGVGDEMLPSFIGTSELTTAGGGRVDVMPALGRRSIDSPENILAKLSRAMIEDVSHSGSISLGDQISEMITRVAASATYDVVLLDSRAGLAELAAPLVTGIGATVLLFGTSQKQTIEGYRALFSSLQLLAQRDRMSNKSAEWRLALKPVYAKASLNAEAGERFIDDIYDLYSAHLYDEEAEADGVTGDVPLRFARNDRSAPHWPLTIPFSPSFVDFDPVRRPGQLSEVFYEQAFRPFLDAIDEIVAQKDTSVKV